ncbi:dihydrolipoyllysine-residue acetyltransferase [Haliea sp.]|jgi:pyruvate dehydrogenase E2 component (dihydrolipoamide acetyltransferase)|uniref:dihydrolipoyllysine-residue acetyltransferase n=1 Tax=Haliea TaxID=475794 RepID=UPI000C4938CB|nr:dihydrolipoyllysine-residue acetyltransferase [Haliea sp.]MAD62798.1 dihydrolipoyllysine-residue acetyltransferase [Haliea sp.]MAY94340.1 dihydrolipoyllysine-residue acetyltransferase [Haliea sp.]MBP71034.1 dihydrolipoyllysine-residue acetyltransferase [Haliea sp.]HCD55632.1 dihydrolipoyllysine-residue acetyltransferase [Halieaceae bacterium]|tara:strand:- start:155 stop:1864 length:1710 start_codon:yes stop_codon:yes gene_type:complete
MAKQQITVPDIGGAEGAEVIELLVAPGDEIELEQGLLVLESDKASMEIPATLAGKVLQVLVKVGDELSEGHPIVVVETADGAAGEDDAEGDAGGDKEDDAPAEPTAKAAKDSAAEASTAADGSAAEKQSDDNAEAREITVFVPDIGTDDAVDVIELSVKPGDEVAEGDSLVVLESDKASMEVPSPQAGKVVRMLVKEGAAVCEGDPLVLLESTVEAAADEPATGVEATADTPQASKVEPTAQREPVPQARAEAAAGKAETAPAAATSDDSLVYAGPAVRKLARELGVDLAKVAGSGPRERILKEDVQGFVQRALSGKAPAAATGSGIPAVPEVDFSAFGAIETVPRTKLDKLTAANMQRSWLNVPHVTQFDDADITELEAFRKSMKEEAEQRGTRLTPMPFLLKACAHALRDNPKFNASVTADGENLVYKQYVHIGIAVDTPVGLLVPVIRDVDRKSLWELADEVVELAEKARERKLKPAEMQGGCFTISSLGNIGGNGFSPIVNTPEVGILGVSRAAVKPVWDGEAFQPRTLLPLSLSYDHRVINGGDAGRFCTQLVTLLGDIRRLLF